MYFVGAGLTAIMHAISAAEQTSAITLIGHNLTLQTKEHLISGRSAGDLAFPLSPAAHRHAAASVLEATGILS